MLEIIGSQLIFSYLVGVVLLTAALAKAGTFEFAARTTQSLLFGERAGGLAPSRLARLVTFGTTLVETAAGVALLTQVFVEAMSLAAAGLFIVFDVALASALFREGKPVACGCSGSKAPVSWEAVIRNGAFFTLALGSAGAAPIAVWGVSVALFAASFVYPRLRDSRTARLAV